MSNEKIDFSVLNSRLSTFAPVSISSNIIYTLCFIATFVFFYFTFADRSDQHVQIKGCRRIGLQRRSNLEDEYDEKYSSGTEEPTNQSGKSAWTVKSLHIYPVKSCRGVELEKGAMISTGMKYDRQFSFAHLVSPFPIASDATSKQASKHKWTFITQRQFPLLAQVKTEVWVPDPSSSTYSTDLPSVQSGGEIVVTFPYEKDGWQGLLARIKAMLHGRVPEYSFTIPFDPTPGQIKEKGYGRDIMTIWKDSPLALNMKSIVPPELKYFLGVSNDFTLFRVDHDNYREVYRCAPNKSQLGYQAITGFCDAYPLHFLNLASIHDVGRMIGTGMPHLSVLRFRGNIVITGPRAYAEDNWKRIRIGKDEYHVSCHTGRCLLPNVDQFTGLKHKVEPNKTLRSFRCIDEGLPHHACLGMQMVPILQQGSIKVGDNIEVLETGEHFYISA